MGRSAHRFSRRDVPSLSGRRTPTAQQPARQGLFVGITLTTTRADILRSVIEGIGLNINLILQDARDKGYVVNSMPIVGGLGKSEFIRQIFADIMNVELIAYEYMDEAATVGAAVLGGIALKLYEDESAVQKVYEGFQHHKAHPGKHEQYKKIMPLFEDVYNAMVPLYEKM
ncbi:MAG: FGGY-family carbohydrate kinase [Christensenellales bacterium]